MDSEKLENELLEAINAAADEPALETLRIAALGKKGTISELLKTLGKMSPQERQIQGPILNGLKDRVTQALAARRELLKAAALTARLEQERLDVTLPVRHSPVEAGRIHPISQVIDEITAIFADMGFYIAEGPDIESDYYNFTALNFPPDHPAREMHDTFFFQPDEKGERKLLRTHTSPVQIRTMENDKPPLRIIVPGKTYRMDSDATHSPMFHQIEGLVVDKQVTIAHMMWVLEEFCRAFFEVPSVKMRFRPSFFPFTEPSMEVDIQCARSGTEVPVRVMIGWKFLVAAWCILMCCVVKGLILISIKALLGGWGLIALPCLNMVWRICGLFLRAIPAGFSIMVFVLLMSRPCLVV